MSNYQIRKWTLAKILILKIIERLTSFILWIFDGKSTSSYLSRQKSQFLGMCILGECVWLRPYAQHLAQMYLRVSFKIRTKRKMIFVWEEEEKKGWKWRRKLIWDSLSPSLYPLSLRIVFIASTPDFFWASIDFGVWSSEHGTATKETIWSPGLGGSEIKGTSGSMN